VEIPNNKDKTGGHFEDCEMLEDSESCACRDGELPSGGDAVLELSWNCRASEGK